MNNESDRRDGYFSYLKTQEGDKLKSFEDANNVRAGKIQQKTNLKESITKTLLNYAQSLNTIDIQFECDSNDLSSNSNCITKLSPILSIPVTFQNICCNNNLIQLKSSKSRINFGDQEFDNTTKSLSTTIDTLYNRINLSSYEDELRKLIAMRKSIYNYDIKDASKSSFGSILFFVLSFSIGIITGLFIIFTLADFGITIGDVFDRIVDYLLENLQLLQKVQKRNKPPPPPSGYYALYLMFFNFWETICNLFILNYN